MNVVLIFTVLILIAIAIWQVTKIFELSQAKKAATQIAGDEDNSLNGKLMLAFLFFIYGITIFSFWKYGDVCCPQPHQSMDQNTIPLCGSHLRSSFLFKP